eukprot:1784788-Rhodomonas_salina.1
MLPTESLYVVASHGTHCHCTPIALLPRFELFAPNPRSQAHVKDPFVFVQSAFWSQSFCGHSVPLHTETLHSFTSAQYAGGPPCT